MRIGLAFCVAALLSACVEKRPPAELSQAVTDIVTNSLYQYKIGDNVDDSAIINIQEGLERGEAYFAEHLNLRDGEFNPKEITINVVATGKGDPHPAGGGSCCVAMPTSSTSVRIFLDVVHKYFKQKPGIYRSHLINKQQTVVHELVHALQAQLGATTVADIQRENKLMPGWMNEGMAEYLAIEAMLYSGESSRRKALEQALAFAIGGGGMKHPLKAYARSNWPAWPGHVGVLALYGLLDHSGKKAYSLIDYARLVGQGTPHNQALEQVYGISQADMYAKVEAWRKKVGQNVHAEPLWSR